jgi:uncharacterized protein YegP (UPF0339 family)
MIRRTWLAMVFVMAAGACALAADGKFGFEIYPDAKDEFRWRLKDGDGKIVGTSGQGYKAKADCKKMVENFKDDISKYTFEVYEAKDEYRWRIKAKNGNVVGSSNGAYKGKADAEKAVDAIKKAVKDATVEEKAKEEKK